MKKALEPFNLDILKLTPEMIKRIGEVTSLAIFEPSSSNFDPKGLFSTEIFGPVGTEDRANTMGLINLRTSVFHPLIFKTLSNLKKLYKDVMAGKAYAVYDPEEKDLILSNRDEGKTGFDFFIKIFPRLEFKRNDSVKRNAAIDLIEKYSKKDLLIDALLVLPAGLRDYTVSEDGKPSEDEINDIYRKIIGTVGLIKNLNLSNIDISLIDATRFKLQTAIFEVYDYIRKLLDGKNKFVAGKWAKRAIVNSTRSVFTSLPVNPKSLNDKNIIGFNDTVVGLHQYTRAILPVFIFKLKSKFLEQIFNPISNIAKLIDSKTLKTVTTEVDPKYKDDWMSEDGITNMVNKLVSDDFKDEACMVGDKYLMLIYDDGKKIRPVIDTTNLPENIDAKYLRPIHYSELFYLAIEDIIRKYPCLTVRYPVERVGSIYPGWVYLKTTIKAREVKLLNPFWEEEKELYEFPILNTAYFNSLCPSTQHLVNLGGDFDGDTGGFTVLYTDDAVKECTELLNSRKFYISPDGKILNSANTDIIEWTMKALTK